MTRPSKRVREQAADLLALLASQKTWACGLYDIPGFTRETVECALDFVQWSKIRCGWPDAWRHAYADAEAALRSGVR